MKFDTIPYEVAQMKETSLQISGMKILEDVKKLSRRPGAWQPARSRSGYQKQKPMDTVDKWAPIQKEKNAPHMGRNAPNARSSTTLKQCVELITQGRARKANSVNLNGDNQTMSNSGATSNEPP